MTQPDDRFWSKVRKTSDCWPWTAAKNAAGYGRFLFNGKNSHAHRVAYELTNGPIPAGMTVDHICHTTSCVNPDHLRLATNKQQRENLAGASKNSSSGVLGVSWAPRRGKWNAQIGHNGRNHNLGYFDTVEEAEAVVKAKRIELFTHNDMDRSVR